jgi:hypothetical protein
LIAIVVEEQGPDHFESIPLELTKFLSVHSARAVARELIEKCIPFGNSRVDGCDIDTFFQEQFGSRNVIPLRKKM